MLLTKNSDLAKFFKRRCCRYSGFNIQYKLYTLAIVILKQCALNHIPQNVSHVAAAKPEQNQIARAKQFPEIRLTS